MAHSLMKDISTTLETHTHGHTCTHTHVVYAHGVCCRIARATAASSRPKQKKGIVIWGFIPLHQSGISAAANRGRASSSHCGSLVKFIGLLTERFAFLLFPCKATVKCFCVWRSVTCRYISLTVAFWFVFFSSSSSSVGFVVVDASARNLSRMFVVGICTCRIVRCYFCVSPDWELFNGPLFR